MRRVVLLLILLALSVFLLNKETHYLVIDMFTDQDFVPTPLNEELNETDSTELEQALDNKKSQEVFSPQYDVRKNRSNDQVLVKKETSLKRVEIEPVEEKVILRSKVDLTLPVIEAGSKNLDIDVLESDRSSLPDFFKEPAVESASKPSFGARVIMDEAFEQMEEYRFNEVRDSIEGAEFTLELKTN